LQQRNAVSARSVYSAVRAHIPLSGNSALLKHRGLFDMTWAAVPQPGLLITDYPQTAASLVGTMNQAGRFTLVGTLGDGEKFTASASLDEALAAPVFSLIYRTSGSLIVPCVFDDTASLGTMQATDSRWFKPVTNVAPYPFGWTQGITFDLSGAVSP